MSVYLGDKKVNIYLNGIKHVLHLITTHLVYDGQLLTTIDNEVLKDSKGYYLISKEVE